MLPYTGRTVALATRDQRPTRVSHAWSVATFHRVPGTRRCAREWEYRAKYLCEVAQRTCVAGVVCWDYRHCRCLALLHRGIISLFFSEVAR